MASRNVARRVTGYAAGGFSFLTALAFIAVAGRVVTLGTGGFLAAAAVSTVGAALAAAETARRLTAARRLRRHGLTAEAAIVSITENYVSVPSGFQGWVTTVRLSFTDVTGQPVNASYTDYSRAGGKRAGQTVQITYDPAQPDSVTPVGDDPRFFEVVFFLAPGSVFMLGFGVYCAVHALS